MGRDEQRAAMRQVREGLIEELEELYRQAFDRISEQDLGEGAIARLTQLLLPAMRERRRGCIVNLSSIAGRFVTPGAGWYGASKHAVEAISDALRLELH